MPGIDGKTLPGSEGLLRPFQQAQSIRDAFFANGATTPSFKVTVRTVRMDNTILNLTWTWTVSCCATATGRRRCRS